MDARGPVLDYNLIRGRRFTGSPSRRLETPRRVQQLFI